MTINKSEFWEHLYTSLTLEQKEKVAEWWNKCSVLVDVNEEQKQAEQRDFAEWVKAKVKEATGNE